MPRPDDSLEDGTREAPRLTLAMRMAERRRLRAERAERLARLVPPRAEEGSAAPARPPETAAARPAVPLPGSDRDAAAALEEFLRSLTQGLGGGTPPPAHPPAPPPAPGEVLPFQRPSAAEAAGRAAPGDGPCDLERLDGVGPGLVWALRRAGIADLAGLAALEPEGLAARLGPLGRLVPARAWIAAARGEAPHAAG